MLFLSSCGQSWPRLVLVKMMIFKNVQKCSKRKFKNVVMKRVKNKFKSNLNKKIICLHALQFT